PPGRSGCVTSPASVCPLARSASNVGSAKVPVPIITIRMQRVPRYQPDTSEAMHCSPKRQRGTNQNPRWRFRRQCPTPPLSGPCVLLLQPRELAEDLLVRRDDAALLVAFELVLERPQRATTGKLADRAHLVDEQHAFQVIGLVLEDAGRHLAVR